ncbi:hypothetical protein APUTEX25_001284 [Auxenochlorella protothecoides]|uniref:Uncharacterized protein n=1 Tax=Auxenochlorella protothecoides TaxID=3075 RepID=A0A3M7KQI8_AUXPR|nr:hypothetical protein APUTEX25_001284 [Auxenochlorella protothecoides]|eukprot:RMZ52090.1 hypothetical protein APUTEX25_001284 [Auxenochlorella protothecoides]
MCNPNAHATAFEARVWLSVKTGGMSVATEAKLSAFRAALEAYFEQLRTSKTAAVKTAEASASSSTDSEEEELKPQPVDQAKDKLYIGFPKGDYKPRRGRTGRIVVDDPSLYPDRDALGIGGWAGGEVGLRAFLERSGDVARYEDAPLETPLADTPPRPAQDPFAGNDRIYVGRGRWITADARKFPYRDAFSGGFAGGELGVRTFLERGDVPIGPPGPRRPSALTIASTVAAAGTVSALLITDAEEVLPGALRTVAVPLRAGVKGLTTLDDGTKHALQIAGVGVGAVLGAVVLSRLVSTLTGKLAAGLQRVAVTLLFSAAFLAAAGYVLELY